jgi:hypothetical protein
MALTPRINEKTPPRTPYCICIFNHRKILFQQKNEINVRITSADRIMFNNFMK